MNTGTVTLEDQDTKLVIQLPCRTPARSEHVREQRRPSDHSSLSLIGTVIADGPAFEYLITPVCRRSCRHRSRSPNSPNVSSSITLTFNVLGIRAITATNTSTITFTNPIATNRKVSLVLQELPNLGQGFAAVASANPSTSVVGDPIDFTVTLSAPAGNTLPFALGGSPKQQALDQGVVLTWRMTTASCFTQAVAQAPFDAAAPFQHFVFPAGQTSAIIRVRSVNNGNCTNAQHTVTHIFEAWIGDYASIRRSPP